MEEENIIDAYWFNLDEYCQCPKDELDKLIREMLLMSSTVGVEDVDNECTEVGDIEEYFYPRTT